MLSITLTFVPIKRVHLKVEPPDQSISTYVTKLTSCKFMREYFSFSHITKPATASLLSFFKILPQKVRQYFGSKKWTAWLHTSYLVFLVLFTMHCYLGTTRTQYDVSPRSSLCFCFSIFAFLQFCPFVDYCFSRAKFSTSLQMLYKYVFFSTNFTHADTNNKCS